MSDVCQECRGKGWHLLNCSYACLLGPLSCRGRCALTAGHEGRCLCQGQQVADGPCELEAK
jgi:hypothetical protein